MNPEVVARVRALCAEGDREALLDAFALLGDHFSSIPLDRSEVDKRQAIFDIQRENIVLNGVEFWGEGTLFLKTLKRVAETLTSCPSCKGENSSSDIVERILCKASRTTSGADSYFAVERLFNTDEYLLQPRKGDSTAPPIHIDLHMSRGHVQSCVSCVNSYVLVDLAEIELASRSSTLDVPEPWLSLDTIVVERTDHYTGRSERYLTLDVRDTAAHRVASKEPRVQRLADILYGLDAGLAEKHQEGE